MPQGNDTFRQILVNPFIQQVAKLQIRFRFTTVHRACHIVTSYPHRDKCLAAGITVIGKLVIIPSVKTRVKNEYHLLVLFRTRQKHFFCDGGFELAVCIEEIDIIKFLQCILNLQKDFKTLQRCIGPWLRFLKDSMHTGIGFFSLQVVCIRKYEVMYLALFQQVLFRAC